MTTQDDFTPEEWNVILRAPAFAALYVALSERTSKPAAYQKMVAGIWAIQERAVPDMPSKLVKAIRAALHAGQRPRYPERFPDDLAATRRLSLAACRQAAVLLTQKVPAHEAVAYASWLLAIGRAVAAAPDDALPLGHSNARAVESARMALEDLAITLSVC